MFCKYKILFETVGCSCSCRRRLDWKNRTCSNRQCAAFEQNVETSTRQWDVRVELSDCTGGICNFRLKAAAAEQLIGHSVRVNQINQPIKCKLYSCFFILCSFWDLFCSILSAGRKVCRSKHDRENGDEVDISTGSLQDILQGDTLLIFLSSM